jgi:Rhs element Vgr protein
MLAVPVLKLEGVEQDGAALGLLSFEVVREANRVPKASIVMEVPDATLTPPLALMPGGLAPGLAVELLVREGDELTSLFSGVLVRLSLTIEDGAARIVAECQDKAIRLTRPRRTLLYLEGTDADAAATILRRNGLNAGDLGPSGPMHPALVQYEASDWDFLVSRAEAAGLVVVVEDGRLDRVRPSLEGEAIELQLRISELLEVELALDGGGLAADVGATGWDAGAGDMAGEASAAPLTLAQGMADPGAVATALALEAERLAHPAPLVAEELSAWASARLARGRLAMLRGRLTLPGTGGAAVMGLVRLRGFSDSFDGTALVSGVRHLVEDGVWTTDLTLGLPAETLVERVADVAPPPAGGLMPPARGLTIGLVADFADDPMGEARVPVRLPAIASGDDILWARLATPEAGNGRGFVFRPEPGDEVVVGFLADDPRFPVVLGALFGARNALPEDFAGLSADNVGKGIATRHGGALVFQDQDSPILTVKTGTREVVLDDQAGAIRLSDGQHELVMESAGITLRSAGTITIEASGALVLKGATVDAN